MSKKHLLHNHQSSHSRPDEKMSPENSDATSPQKVTEKKIAARKRRQWDSKLGEYGDERRTRIVDNVPDES